MMQWVIAVILIWSPTVFTSCNYVSNKTLGNGDDSDRSDNNVKTIWVLSDIHVMAPELFQGTGKAEEMSQNSKLLQYSAEILDKLIASALSTKPDLLLITGDLTENGDLVSHQHVVSKLSQLRSAGIKVVVIPGNHDIDHTADPTSSQQFAEMYKNLGYNLAYARDKASLSYVCEPFDGLVLLCIDTASGKINESTLTWMLDQADKARAKGKQVVALQHHNIAEHYDRQSSMQRRYILKNYKEMSQKMMQHGIHMVFTGHTHVNDIAQYRTDTDSIVDVETGSLLAYPNAWRKINVNEDFTKWDFSMGYVKKIPSTADVQKLSYQVCMNSLPSIVRGNADVLWPALDRKRGILTNIKLDGAIIPTTLEEFRDWFAKGLGDKICQALIMHIEGNEGKNPKSAALTNDIRETLIDMFRKRFAEYNVPDDKANLLLLFVGAYYNKSYRLQMESMLTDTNQLSEENLSNITDDLNTVLYLGK
jgi:3',5'-cyclic AMP phosphodiesterase CpdA